MNWHQVGTWWDILLFILFSLITIFSSYTISLVVNQIEKKSKLSSSFVSGILLSVMTALPELICSIVIAITYIHGNPADPTDHSIGLAIGDLLGGNFINLIFLAVAIICTFKWFKKFKVTKVNVINCISLCLAYILIAINMLIPKNGGCNLMLGHTVNVISILLLLIFAFNMFIMTRKQEEKEEPKEIFSGPKEYEMFSKLSLLQLFMTFLGIGIVLGGGAIGLTIAADNTIQYAGIGKSTGGALLLGIATSIPELITLIALLKMKNFNAAVSEILGSALMSLLIIVTVDFVYQGTPFDDGNIYYGIKEDKILAVLVLIGFASISAMLFIKYFQKKQGKKKDILYASFLSLSIIAYIAYIISVFAIK